VGHNSKHFGIAAASILAVMALSGTAHAQVYTSSTTYNSPYGMSQADTNSPVNPSLRDSNNNMELVNGQFLTSSMSQQSGAQNMNPLTGSGVGGSVGAQAMSMGSSTSGQYSTGSGVGNVSTTGTATAIGNSLNVITVGNNNTVVVNSRQTNNGNQTANASVGGN
jgi:holdfast attachment protein HfaA